MILYLDTSAWVKLYVHELGSKKLRAYSNKVEALAASVSAYPEAHATFARIKAQGISTETKRRQRLYVAQVVNAFINHKINAE